MSAGASAPDSSFMALGCGFHSRPFHHQRRSALIKRIASSAYYCGWETQPRSCSVVAMTELSPEETLQVEADCRRRMSGALRHAPKDVVKLGTNTWNTASNVWHGIFG